MPVGSQYVNITKIFFQVPLRCSSFQEKDFNKRKCTTLKFPNTAAIPNHSTKQRARTFAHVHTHAPMCPHTEVHTHTHTHLVTFACANTHPNCIHMHKSGSKTTVYLHSQHQDDSMRRHQEDYA